MRITRISLIVCVFIVLCAQVGASQEAPPAQPEQTGPAGAQADKQLNINRTTLLEGTTEQIRVDAATMMLLHESPKAREALLEVLKPTGAAAARTAICKALYQSRATQKPLRSAEDFSGPLIALLRQEKDLASARLAAEATLIFTYTQIGGDIEKIVCDPNAPVQARLNCVYALKLHPEMKAGAMLIALLDDPDRQVAGAAKQALLSLGIQVSDDPQARRGMISDLERLGPEAFLRGRLIQRETRIRELEGQLRTWQSKYLLVLEQLYDSQSDDAARSAFFVQHLGGSEMNVRLWALDKLAQWRRGTDKPKLSAELEALLLTVISDPSREIRLRTARLLSFMSDLNSAQHLLEQLKAEKDAEVQLELFTALGGACYYASLPNSSVQIPAETRKEALVWADDYLDDPDPEKARRGADGMRKLLEQDGLTAKEVEDYLGALSRRYAQTQGAADGDLRSELVGAMAALCAQRSVYRAQAAETFTGTFDAALGDESDLVRQAAVDGLINIDRSVAMGKLRSTALINDSSATIRGRLIALAGDVGTPEDLKWLVEKLGGNGDSEPAWQSMLKVFGRADSKCLEEWVGKLAVEAPAAKLKDPQMLSLLQVAEKKAVAENRQEMRDQIRGRLVRFHEGRSQFQQAADYLALLRETAAPEQKASVLSDLIGIYLKWPKLDAATEVVQQALAEADLPSDSPVIRRLDAYMATPPEGADPKALLKLLEAIQVTAEQPRPVWQGQIKKWSEAFAKAIQPVR